MIFCHNIFFCITWYLSQFGFCHKFSFGVLLLFEFELSQLEFLNFVTIWVFNVLPFFLSNKFFLKEFFCVKKVVFWKKIYCWTKTCIQYQINQWMVVSSFWQQKWNILCCWPKMLLCFKLTLVFIYQGYISELFFIPHVIRDVVSVGRIPLVQRMSLGMRFGHFFCPTRWFFCPIRWFFCPTRQVLSNN